MCDKNVHSQLITISEPICPFCDQLLIEGDKAATEQCCDKQNIENINSFNTCLNCGSVYGYTTYENEYVDFHANILKIRKSLFITVSIILKMC